MYYSLHFVHTISPTPDTPVLPVEPVLNDSILIDMTDSVPLIHLDADHIDATAAWAGTDSSDFRPTRRPAPVHHNPDPPSVTACVLSLDGSWMVNTTSSPSLAAPARAPMRNPTMD